MSLLNTLTNYLKVILEYWNYGNLIDLITANYITEMQNFSNFLSKFSPELIDTMEGLHFILSKILRIRRENHFDLLNMDSALFRKNFWGFCLWGINFVLTESRNLIEDSTFIYFYKK